MPSTSDRLNRLDEELKAAVRSYPKKPWSPEQECGAALQKYEFETAYMSVAMDVGMTAGEGKRRFETLLKYLEEE
jgi:IS30 family transposase